ncbi:arsenate reductase [Thioclava dalianensis]|uniref:Arsenate reductase n=1 Tax=Thioclava dalianensis TaxID=1185766 RepID=A0A074TKL3_9RHOB|nr:arsenate reductase family protein [Thioclava dalianensis]KEP70700.1 arsenate reductase [Thioclava dalianensis]SFN04648.1 arsenate reductase [Thioclava dalianensis]
MAVTIWHNPRCSKSRQTLALLQAHGLEPVIRDYRQDPPSLDELMEVLGKLGTPAAAMLRWKDTDLPKDAPEVTILATLAAEPALIERPVVITERAARIGRPPEAVLEIL